jgi:hypothetical protein
MRPCRARRRRLWNWCWALGFALICVYVAFDLLDIDGSDLRTRLGLRAVAAADAQGEAERTFRIELSPSEPWVRHLLEAGDSMVADILGIKSRGPLGFAIIRHGPLLPRRLLSLATTATHTPPTDPDPA